MHATLGRPNSSASHHHHHHHHHHLSADIIQQTKNQNYIQTFAVNYNGSTFNVDPVILSQSSIKFKELIQPYIQNTEQMKELHLEINGTQFSKRNIENFLRICQKLPTDVQDSEMEEICEIAKLFKANDIYNKGLDFVKSSIDPNFNIPDDKYDGPNCQSYLTIEGLKNLMENDSDLSDDFFENTKDDNCHGNYYQINENKNNNSAEQVINSKMAPSNKDKHHKPKKIKTNVIYTIKIPNHGLKCPTFKFYRNDQILFTAKQKDNSIFFADGGEVHVSLKETHIAHIFQNLMVNTVFLKNNRFVMKYVNTGKPHHYSIETPIPLIDEMVTCTPRKPKYDPKKDKYVVSYKGEYNHIPIPSIKNILLEDKDGKTVFITRKMAENLYEIECLPTVEPLVAFCLGVSDIVGPFCDPVEQDN